MTTKEKIKRSVGALSPQERDDLIEDLILERAREQVATIGRRIAEMDSGEVEGIPGDEVMAELRNRLHGRT